MEKNVVIWTKQTNSTTRFTLIHTYITYYSSEEISNQAQTYTIDTVINGAAVGLED